MDFYGQLSKGRMSEYVEDRHQAQSKDHFKNNFKTIKI